MSEPGSRPRTFEVLRCLPVLGRAMDLGLGEAAASKTTREAGATEFEELELDQAMDMIAERLIAAREAGWQDTRPQRLAGRSHARLRASRRGDARQRGEPLIKKLFTAMGAIQIENQARI